MWKSFHRLLSLLLCFTLVPGGCAQMTPGQQAALGGLLGAGAGAGIGKAVGGTKGALIGAGIGAAAGVVAAWAIADYEARRTQNANETFRAYGYKKSQGTRIEMRNARVAPRPVSPGQQVAFETEYALLADSQVEVQEDWQVFDDKGNQVARTPQKSVSRQPGGWRAKAKVNLPGNVQAGRYTVKHSVQAGLTRGENQSELEVRGGAAASPAYSDDSSLMRVQGRLKELGYDPGAVDGQPGRKTTSALKNFQKDRSLPVTGRVDAKTRDALGLTD